MCVHGWFLSPWLRKPIRWVTPDLSPFWVRGLVNRRDAA